RHLFARRRHRGNERRRQGVPVTGNGAAVPPLRPGRISVIEGLMPLRFIFVAAALALSAGTALAQSVQSLGDFRDWSAYTAAEGNGMVCFAMSKPTEVAPPVDGYTQAYL